MMLVAGVILLVTGIILAPSLGPVTIAITIPGALLMNFGVQQIVRGYLRKKYS